MKFHLGKIPESNFKPDESWTPLREPGPIVMQFCALPIGLIAAFAIGYGWSCILHDMPPLRLVGRGAVFALIWFPLSIPILIVVHELIHAWVHPQFGRTDESAVGFWPSRLVFYAGYLGEHSRERFIAIFAAPFLVISVLPLVLFAFAASAFGTTATTFAAFLSTFNALCACGYLFGIALLLCQVPRGATTRNLGWRTYWKPGPTR